MTSKFKRIAVVAISVMLSAPPAANATLFTFDPDGAAPGFAPIPNVALMDQSPGTALAQGGITAIRNFLTGSGTINFDLRYQANLGAVQVEDGSNAFSNGTGGHFFTFVGGFQEKVIGAAPFPSTATFALAGPATYSNSNFFNMYATGAIGNNLTGVGFKAGTPILTAHVVDEPTTNFQVTSTTPVNLDQSPNGNNWGVQQSVTGGGLTELILVVDTFNPAYFPDLNPLTAFNFAFFSTSTGDPFRQVDPSRCFNTATVTATANCTTGYNNSLTLGATNGALDSGPDFLLQADGTTSLLIPEPTTTALFGIGLVLMGLRSRSRKGGAA